MTDPEVEKKFFAQWNVLPRRIPESLTAIAFAENGSRALTPSLMGLHI